MTLEKSTIDTKLSDSLLTAPLDQASVSSQSFPTADSPKPPSCNPSEPPSQWHSRHLGLRLAADAAAAVSAASLIAPLISLVDRSSPLSPLQSHQLTLPSASDLLLRKPPPTRPSSPASAAPSSPSADRTISSLRSPSSSSSPSTPAPT